MKYCDVNTVLNIPPESATSFLLEMSTGLSEDTANRRASSLKQWAITFQNILR